VPFSRRVSDHEEANLCLNRVVTTFLLRVIAAALLSAGAHLGVAMAQTEPIEQFGASTASAVELSSSEMLVGAGDLIQVTVYGTDFDRQVRVSDTGEISLPLLGTVKVGGLSIKDAEQFVGLQLARKGYFTDPQVSIFDREYATQAISVLGEVQKPGIYPLPGARTLFDAISAAGGTTDKAGNQVTITHRGHTDNPQVVPLSYVGDSSVHSNVKVLPGDTVAVARAGIVYVVGDVRKPSGIVMQNSQLTALQAIAMAEGTNPTAALNGSKLIRKTPQGLKEVPLPLKKILAAKAPDVNLQPNDILFVPNSAAKSAARRSLEAVVQTATGVAIYRPY
jgi:polysaccharide biosynthesis/export protein